MMMGAVKEIRHANRGNRGGGFDGSESGVIVHNVVGEQRFIAAATAKIQSGEVIKSAGSTNGGEEQAVFAIPERMLERRRFWLPIPVLRAGRLLRGIEGRANDQRRSVIPIDREACRYIERKMCRDEQWRRECHRGVIFAILDLHFSKRKEECALRWRCTARDVGG